MAELRNKATLDTKPFNSGLKGMEGRVNSFAGKLKGAYRAAGAGVAVGSMVALGKAALKSADQIDNLAQQTDLGIESVQAMKIAAEELGVGFETLRPSINQLRRASDKASAGGKDMVDAFDKLGISMRDLQSMTTEDKLEAVSKALVANEGNAEIAAAATKVLGAESTRILPVLKSLAEDGVAGLTERYKELGLVMSEDLVAAGDKMEEGLSRAAERLKNSFKSAAVSTGLLAVAIARANEASKQKDAGGFLSVFKKSGREAFSKEFQATFDELLSYETQQTVSVEKRQKAREREAQALQEVAQEVEAIKEAEASSASPSLGKFARIGANMTAGAVVSPHEQRKLNMQQQILKTAEAQERLLKEIADKRSGSTF